MFAKITADKWAKRTAVPNNKVNKLKKTAKEQLPLFDQIEDKVFIKKGAVVSYEHPERKKVLIYTINDKVVMIELNDGKVLPPLDIAMAYPGLLPVVYVDDGAVKPLLGGAKLMTPGIKQWGEDFEEDAIVEVRLLGTTVPFAVGYALSSSDAIKAKGDGAAIEIVHTLKDGIWNKNMCP